MSDYVWQPVENQEDAIAAAMQHILRWDKLPADAALCRRVPASAGVPVEALNRITAWVADWCNGNDDGFDDLAADVIDVRTWLRSLAPAQGQKGE